MEDILVELLSFMVAFSPSPVRLIVTASRFFFVKLALLLLVLSFLLFFIHLRFKNNVKTMTKIKTKARIGVMNQIVFLYHFAGFEGTSVSKSKVNTYK